MYYIYLLYSPAFDKYYIGYTSDIYKRLNDHNTQEYFNTFTSKYRPWKLNAAFEVGNSETDAIQMERFIKKQKSRKFLVQLSDPEFIPTGKLAQLVRVPHMRY